MKTRQRCWIIHGISSVKHFISECGKSSVRNANPIRQLMADLPACRLTASKPFKFCGLDYLGPLIYKQCRSDCKAWNLLFICLYTLCIDVESITNLDLNSFLLAFSQFANRRGIVDTVFFGTMLPLFVLQLTTCLNC